MQIEHYYDYMVNLTDGDYEKVENARVAIQASQGRVTFLDINDEVVAIFMDSVISHIVRLVAEK